MTQAETAIKVAFDEPIIKENGALGLDYPWIEFFPGRKEISLDGDFTSTQLRAFAAYMDEKNA